MLSVRQRLLVTCLARSTIWPTWLAVWASEFQWAHRLMQRFKHALHVYQGWTRRRKVVFWLAFVAVCGLLGWAYLVLVGQPAWFPLEVDRVLAYLPGVDLPR